MKTIVILGALGFFTSVLLSGSGYGGFYTQLGLALVFGALCVPTIFNGEIREV